MSENPDAYRYNWITEIDHDALQASKDRDAIYRVGGLRDQFAAQALNGLLAADVGEDKWHTYEAIVKQAWSLADAMLAARKAKP